MTREAALKAWETRRKKKGLPRLTGGPSKKTLKKVLQKNKVWQTQLMVRIPVTDGVSKDDIIEALLLGLPFEVDGRLEMIEVLGGSGWFKQ